MIGSALLVDDASDCSNACCSLKFKASMCLFIISKLWIILYTKSPIVTKIINANINNQIDPVENMYSCKSFDLISGCFTWEAIIIITMPGVKNING